MTSLFTQLIYILLGGLFVAALATTWVLVGAYNEKHRKKQELVSCNMSCLGCSSASSCHREDKNPM